MVDAAVKLATLHNRTVHVVHAQEQAMTVGEEPEAAEAHILIVNPALSRTPEPVGSRA